MEKAALDNRYKTWYGTSMNNDEPVLAEQNRLTGVPDGEPKSAEQADLWQSLDTAHEEVSALTDLLDNEAENVENAKTVIEGVYKRFDALKSCYPNVVAALEDESFVDAVSSDMAEARNAMDDAAKAVSKAVMQIELFEKAIRKTIRAEQGKSG